MKKKRIKLEEALMRREKDLQNWKSVDNKEKIEIAEQDIKNLKKNMG